LFSNSWKKSSCFWNSLSVTVPLRTNSNDSCKNILRIRVNKLPSCPSAQYFDPSKNRKCFDENSVNPNSWDNRSSPKNMYGCDVHWITFQHRNKLVKNVNCECIGICV
jgi:hypothetical protein